MRTRILKFPTLSGFALALALTCTASLAAGNAIVKAKVDPVPLYATAGGAASVSKLPASKLPLEVRAVSGDFLRVNVDGRDFWIDSMDVQTSQKVVAGCSAVNVPNTRVAGEMGAGSDRCK